MMTATFDEAKHRRAGDGKFAAKGHAPAEDSVGFDVSGRAHLAVPTASNLPLADGHPELPPEVQFDHSTDRVLLVERQGRQEAYFIDNDVIMQRAMPDGASRRRREREPLSFSDEELAELEPAPLQSPIQQPKPRLRDLDVERSPRNVRAKVSEELDRPLGWLPAQDDGSPGTIRSEIAAGRIVGKKMDAGGQYFMRTSIPEGSSSAVEDSSHKAIGVSKSLFKALSEK